MAEKPWKVLAIQSLLVRMTNLEREELFIALGAQFCFNCGSTDGAKCRGRSSRFNRHCKIEDHT